MTKIIANLKEDVAKLSLFAIILGIVFIIFDVFNLWTQYITFGIPLGLFFIIIGALVLYLIEKGKRK